MIMPTFKVHVQRFVEETATIEVDAGCVDCAVRIARDMAKADAPGITWGDGDDVEDIDAYAAHDESGDLVWER